MAGNGTDPLQGLTPRRQRVKPWKSVLGAQRPANVGWSLHTLILPFGPRSAASEDSGNFTSWGDLNEPFLPTYNLLKCQKMLAGCQHLTWMTSRVPLNSLWVLNNQILPHLASLQRALRKMTFLKMNHNREVPGGPQPAAQPPQHIQVKTIHSQNSICDLKTPRTNKCPGQYHCLPDTPQTTLNSMVQSQQRLENSC